MDVATRWEWFEGVFRSELRKRTRRPVLLLMDNAPGHFPAVERNDIKVLFFPPSCSSWKQPSDVGIIAALKKSYKYLYLKVVLDFFEVEGPQKKQAKRLRRGAAGVAYGNSAHMLDAAQYIRFAWDAISDAAIKNAFGKVDLLSLGGGADEEVVLMADLLRSFNALNIPRDESSAEEFVHIGDENNEVFSRVILDDDQPRTMPFWWVGAYLQ